MSDDAELVKRARRNAGWRNENWQCITDPSLLEELAARIETLSATLTAQADEIERLNAIVKRVQGAAKTIMHHEGEELARLRKQAQEHHAAISTLDSEREANALLTAENERLRNDLEVIAEVDDDGFTSDGHERCVEWAQRALKAAQEVKA